MKNKLLIGLNTVSFIAVVTVNLLANILPIGLGNTGAISARHPDLFTPAPVTFAIWGVIYLLMTGFILYQWGLFGHKDETAADVSAIGPMFVLSSMLNIGWIFAWHHDIQWLSLVLITALLLTVRSILHRLDGSGRHDFGGMLTNVGFGLYFGWLCAAVLANNSVFLVSIGITASGTAQIVRTVLLITLGTLIGAALTVTEKQKAATIAVMWAYTGILVRHIGAEGFAGRYSAVIITASLGLALMLVTITRRDKIATKRGNTAKNYL